MGKSGEDGADGAIILHGGHVVIDLVAGDLSFFVECDFDIGESGGGLRGPLEILGTHPLHAHRLADSLRKNHGFVFGASVAAVGSAVVAGSRIRVHDDVIGRGAEHRARFRRASACGFWLCV